MWRTEDGRLHTVALPDPGQLFTPEALAGAEAVLRDVGPDEAQELVDELQDETSLALDDVPVDQDEERRFAHTAPPLELVREVADDEEDLRRLVSDVDHRWRLDVAFALEDLIDRGA